MLDDFVVRALLGGLGVAAIAGPLGCFVVWRRMAYFGNALAHSALLGIAVGVLLAVDLTAATLGVCLAFAGTLVLLQRQRQLATDTLLGILAHVALALGLIALGTIETVRVDLSAYLFGDVLAIDRGRPALDPRAAALPCCWRCWRCGRRCSTPPCTRSWRRRKASRSAGCRRSSCC